MSKLAIRNHDWVAVCDGRKALLLQNEGDEIFPNLKMRERYEHETRSNREIDPDRPGRFEETATGARSAIESVDHHLAEEQTFLTGLSARLSELVVGGEVRRIVIVAPPRALGILRKSYPASVQSAIQDEINHDLVHLPVHKIENYLTGH